MNVAGISRSAPLDGADEGSLDAMWTSNVKGPRRAIRAALPHLRAVGTGRVLNIASMSGNTNRPND